MHVDATVRVPSASGDAMVATFHWPEGVAAGRTPCVVMGAGGTLTRRDGIPAYAERLASAGFVALSFDYRHWGDSDGQPRRLVSIPRQLADWRSAVACARASEGIDPDRIAVWGMSFGGGHAISTAAEDTRIAAVVALVPMADGLAFSLSPRFARLSARAVADRLRRSRRPLPAVGRAGAFPPEELPHLQRLTAGGDWRNEVNVALDHPMSIYRPVRRARRIQAPVLVQLGEKDALAPRRAVEAVARNAPRGELRRYPVDHFGCFWPEHLDRVADDQIEFLRHHLLRPSSSTAKQVRRSKERTT
jgi:quorum-quenching protein AidA